MSASYTSTQHWVGLNSRHYAFQGNVLYRHTVFKSGKSHVHQAMADLGYLKFIDSLWIKDIDRIQANFLWCRSENHLKQSYTVAFSTQFLPGSMLLYNSESGSIEEAPVGGFLNPFTLDAGYGAVLTFWKTSNINFAFATLRFSSSPKLSTPIGFAEANTIEGRTAYYFLTYGFSIGTAINHDFGSHIKWINNSRFFGNGIDRNHVNVDFRNMVVVKLWKYIQLRLDTRLVYNPMLNYNLQFRQEVLVGFFYERNK